MTTALSATALMVIDGATTILARGLEVARVLGLPVTTWSAGDPTRSLYKHVAEELSTKEQRDVTFIKSGWLSTAVADAEASGDSSWLKILALEVFGVTATEATYAAPTVTLINAGGGFYEEDALALTFRATSINKTYRNLNAVTINPGETVTLDLIAEEAGSDSSVTADEIDEMVTPLGAGSVTVDSSTAAVALDEQSPAAIGAQCEATLGALSPNGPADAYEYVARNSDLTGTTEVTRADAVDDSDALEVTLYIAGPSGAVSGSAVTAVQDAIETWATPLCVTPTVVSAAAYTLAVDADVSGDSIPGDAEASITTVLEQFLAEIDIGGTIARSALIALIHNKLAALGATGVSVTLNTPAANVTLAANEAPTLGAVVITEV